MAKSSELCQGTVITLICLSPRTTLLTTAKGKRKRQKFGFIIWQEYSLCPQQKLQQYISSYIVFRCSKVKRMIIFCARLNTISYPQTAISSPFKKL